MNILVADNLSKGYGNKTLFENVSFGIDDHDRIGLIGINGTGKSTLLKIIAGIEKPDEGTVITRNGLKISYLPQTPEFDSSMSLLENVIKDKNASQSYRNLAGEAAAMLKKIGIDNPEVSPDILSGGQRKRASLIRALLTESDLLVLDEPTNHLDAQMTEWLEDTLKGFKGAVVCITHDRYFLDEVTDRIFELDRRSLYTYTANYAKFVELKALREDMAIATERKARTLFRSELAWMLRGARARSTKQKAHIRRFEALKDRKTIETVETVEIAAAFSRMGKKTLEAKHIGKFYDDRVLFKDFDYIFLQNERIGIIGPNGCGKSTLLKCLIGKVPCDEGSVEYGTTLKIGYFAQECEFMNPDEKVIDYIRDTAEVIRTKEGAVTASRMCEKFLFNADLQYAPIGKLSGGEKRRLYLLKILMTAPNLLILDEPTNDLDIMTLTILEDYLQSFEGIIITVSHDRYFLDKLVNRLFVFRENGIVEQVEGNYTDYKDKELERSEMNQPVKAASSTSSDSKAAFKNHETKLKFTYKEQREFETIDGDIASLEKRIAEKDSEIEAAVSDYFKLQQLMEEKKQMESELEEKTERWLYLTELAEKIEAQKA